MTTKKKLLKQLEKRIKTAPEKIENASLHAGAPMTFYCKECGHISDVLPETYINPPKKLCDECQVLEDEGWLDVE